VSHHFTHSNSHFGYPPFPDPFGCGAKPYPGTVQLVSHFDIRPTMKTWIDDHPPILSTRIRLLTMAIMVSGLLGHPNISSQRS